jgi:hypothetical protein
LTSFAPATAPQRSPCGKAISSVLSPLPIKKLLGAPRGMADEEDVALSAFDSFCRGAEQGRFPQLSDRDDLWRLLFVITERKAIDLVNHEKAQKARRRPGAP